MTKRLNFLLIRLFLVIVSSTNMACVTPAVNEFSNEYFSVEFPSGYAIEKNNDGAVLAFDGSSGSVFIINYEKTQNQNSADSCKKMSEDFFSKIQREYINPVEASDFIMVRSGKVIGGGEGFASLGYYCKNNIILQVSFVYRLSSGDGDFPFLQVVEKIYFK